MDTGEDLEYVINHGQYTKVVSSHHACIGLSEEGTVKCFNADSPTSGLNRDVVLLHEKADIKDIFCSWYHNFAIDNKGEIFTDGFFEKDEFLTDGKPLLGDINLCIRSNWKDYKSDLFSEDYYKSFIPNDIDKNGTITIRFSI